jgi:hypothetical protein
MVFTATASFRAADGVAGAEFEATEADRNKIEPDLRFATALASTRMLAFLVPPRGESRLRQPPPVRALR